MSIKDSVRKAMVRKTASTITPVKAMASNCDSHYIDHCILYCWKLSEYFFKSLNVFDKIMRLVNIIKSQPLSIHLLNILSDE